MFKKYKDFICEIEDTSGSTSSDELHSIDASGPISDKICEVGMDIDFENEDVWLSVYLPARVHFYKDLNINADWYEKWPPEEKKKMEAILKACENQMSEIFKEALVKTKELIVKASTEVDKLEPLSGKVHGRKYGI